MASLDKTIQETLLGRLQALPPEKLQALDMEFGPNAAQVMLYDILPELDFLLLENVSSLEGHQYQPERVLAHVGQQEQMMAQEQAMAEEQMMAQDAMMAQEQAMAPPPQDPMMAPQDPMMAPPPPAGALPPAMPEQPPQAPMGALGGMVASS